MKQKYFTIVNKLGSVQRNAKNPFAKSKYATLSNIQQNLAPLLEEQNCFLSFDFGSLENGVYNIKLSLHATDSEEVMTWPFAVPMDTTLPNKVQAFGSTMTYAQRYALCIAFQIALDDEDPDARPNQAAPPATTPAAPHKPVLKPGTDKWNKAIVHLATTGHWDVIAKNYTITEADMTALENEVKTYKSAKS